MHQAKTVYTLKCDRCGRSGEPGDLGFLTATFGVCTETGDVSEVGNHDLQWFELCGNCKHAMLGHLRGGNALP